MVPISFSGEGDDRSQHDILKKLSDLPSKTRSSTREGTLRSFVKKWYRDLKSAQERGYTYQDLVTFLEKEAGISTTAGTLRKYMNWATKEMSGEGSSPQEGKPVPQKPVRTSEQLITPQKPKQRPMAPRPTLYARKPEVQASEDEFENL
ncbi:hypothetical protein [Phormidium tenue]|nr:hypothetical protein [Phormidium tenue]MBD2231491.1 hypothetical protein [Phormidium tenue FACHB-1052]